MWTYKTNIVEKTLQSLDINADDILIDLSRLYNLLYFKIDCPEIPALINIKVQNIT